MTKPSRQDLSFLICLEEAQTKLQGELGRGSHRLVSLTSIEGPDHSAEGLGWERTLPFKISKGLGTFCLGSRSRWKVVVLGYEQRSLRITDTHDITTSSHFPLTLV